LSQREYRPPPLDIGSCPPSFFHIRNFFPVYSTTCNARGCPTTSHDPFFPTPPTSRSSSPERSFPPAPHGRPPVSALPVTDLPFFFPRAKGEVFCSNSPSFLLLFGFLPGPPRPCADCYPFSFRGYPYFSRRGSPVPSPPLPDPPQ